MAKKTKIKYKNFQDYYDAESSLGRKKFLKESKKLKEEEREKLEVLKEKGLLPEQRASVSREASTLLSKDPYQRRSLPSLSVGQNLSREQDFMMDLFGGRGDNRVLFQNPESRCQTEIRGALMPHAFGDETESETAESFGLVKGGTGRFFGF